MIEEQPRFKPGDLVKSKWKCSGYSYPYIPDEFNEEVCRMSPGDVVLVIYPKDTTFKTAKSLWTVVLYRDRVVSTLESNLIKVENK